MIKKLKQISFAVLMILICSQSNATEIIHYDNLPVTIELREGQERSIQFGDFVSVGLTKGQLAKNLFRVQSAQGAIHILPRSSFDKQRVQVKRISDGKVILLDLVAVKAEATAKPLEDIKLMLESENVLSNTANREDLSDEDVNERLSSISPVDLTRFASQRLYGPSRLHNDVPGAVETTLGVKGAIRLFKGGNKLTTYAHAIVAYQGGGYYLAGIHIKKADSTAKCITQPA